jgi:hypothetical protein
MYSLPLLTTASQRSGRFSIPRPKKSSGLAVKISLSQTLEFGVVVEENSAQIVGERERAEEVVIRWDKIWRVGRMWKNLPVAFQDGHFRHVYSVVGRCHAEESLHVVDPGIFAGLLPPDGEVVDNSVQQ